jgi:DNA-binding transcriptional ArsR family regulator
VEVSAERQYVEEFGTVLAGMGLPPAYAKLMGWLIICDPPRQSVTEIADALGQSKGSVSSGARLLENAGLIRRVAVPGRRGTFYELDPEAIIRVTEEGWNFRAFRELLDRGLRLLGDEAGPRAERLRRTRDFYAFIEREVPKLMARFRDPRQSDDGGGSNG